MNPLIRRLAPLALLTVCTTSAAPPKFVPKKPVIGQLAPEFQLKLVDGTKVSLSELRGQVVVLNFWATWCVPCRTELPLLDTYYKIQQPRGLRVFAVATEGSPSLYRMRGLFKLLTMQSAASIKGPYGPMTGVPTNFVIDRSGRLRYAKAGAFDLDALNEVLVPLILEKPPAT